MTSYKNIDRQKDRYAGKQGYYFADRHTESKAGRQAGKQAGRQAGRQADNGTKYSE